MYKVSDIYFVIKRFFGGVIMKNKCFVISEAAGCAVIFPAAVFLHFIIQWFGPGALTILFGAVNESVWEHVKIFSASYIAYALLELLWIRVGFRRYVVAKCVGLYALMGGLIAFHYGYRTFTGRAYVWADIAGSAVIVILAQVISCGLTLSRLDLREYFAPAVCLLMLYYLMFFSFTIYPPKAELFRDPLSGGFGYTGFSAKKQ